MECPELARKWPSERKKENTGLHPPIIGEDCLLSTVQVELELAPRPNQSELVHAGSRRRQGGPVQRACTHHNPWRHTTDRITAITKRRNAATASSQKTELN